MLLVFLSHGVIGVDGGGDVEYSAPWCGESCFVEGLWMVIVWWIPENAHKYFKERDPIALDYLPKLLGN